MPGPRRSSDLAFVAAALLIALEVVGPRRADRQPMNSKLRTWEAIPSGNHWLQIVAAYTKLVAPNTATKISARGVRRWHLGKQQRRLLAVVDVGRDLFQRWYFLPAAKEIILADVFAAD